MSNNPAKNSNLVRGVDALAAIGGGHHHPFCPGRHSGRRRAMRLALGACAAALMLTVAGAPAFAQDQGTLDKLVQLNKKAMDDYDTADFDLAKKSLLDAEKLGKRTGFENHPVMARTYIHLGALYLVGYKDRQKAQHYFGKALDIQPDINLDRTLTSSSVRDLFASVKAQRGEPPSDESAPPAQRSRLGARKGRAALEAPVDSSEPAAETTVRQGQAGPDAEPDLPATITALDCPYPDDTPPGKKVTLRCVAAANLGVAGVALHYKGFGMSDYESLPMAKSSKGWWQATVPRRRVEGKSLQFYFEGFDASDTPVVSNGRAQSPNVMLIVDRGNAVVGGSSNEEENPLEEQRRQGPKLVLGTYDSSQEGMDTRYGNRRFWIGFGIGTSAIYAIDGVPESRVRGNLLPGVSPPSFDQTKDVKITGFGLGRIGQAAPEIGFQFNADWAVAIEGRLQWIYQSKSVASYTASGAMSALLKVIRYTKQARFRMFFALAGGGGEGARMGVQTDPQGNADLWDTVLVGQVLLGGTAGLTYEINKKFSFVTELNALYGFPKKGFDFDLNAGFQMSFGDTSGAAEAAAAKKKESVSGSVDDDEPK